jgi:DNA-binding transcriptional LysR family regulator
MPSLPCEKELSVALLHRTPRSVRLTRKVTDYLSRTQRAFAELTMRHAPFARTTTVRAASATRANLCHVDRGKSAE